MPFKPLQNRHHATQRIQVALGIPSGLWDSGLRQRRWRWAGDSLLSDTVQLFLLFPQHPPQFAQQRANAALEGVARYPRLARFSLGAA